MKRRIGKRLLSAVMAVLLVISGGLFSAPAYAAGGIASYHYFDWSLNNEKEFADGSVEGPEKLGRIELDGTGTAFCLEPTALVAVSQSGYYGISYVSGNDAFITKILNNDAVQKKMELAVYFGWTTTQKTDKDYAFTQMFIWRTLIYDLFGGALRTTVGKTVTDARFGNASTNAQYHTWKNEINKKINAVLNTNLSFNKGKYMIPQGGSITLTDTSGTLDKYHFIETSADGVSVKKQGNTVVVQASKDAVANKSISFNLRRQVFKGADLNGTTLFYYAAGHPECQRIGTIKGLDPNDNLFTVTVTPAPKVTVEKVDVNTKKPIAGAQFKLVEKANPSKAVLEWTSETSPKLIENLKPNTAYQIFETKAPTGYVAMTNPVEFTTRGDSQILPISINNIVTRVHVSKTDEGGKLIPGAKMHITDEAGKEIVAPWISTDKPHIVEKLEVGKTYYLEELEAPTGYVKAEKIPFTVSNKAVIQNVSLANIKQMGKVKIQKKDITDSGLSLMGAVYNLVVVQLDPYVTDPQAPKVGEVAGTLTTTENGSAVSDNLYLGVYDLVEVTPPKGFSVNPVARRIQLVWDPSVKEGYRVIALSEDHEGVAKAFDAQIAAYRETLAKYNLTKSVDIPTFTPEKDGDSIWVHDKAMLGYLLLEKQKETLLDPETNEVEEGADLESGTSFELLDESGAVVDTLVTEKNGRAISKLLPIGTYTLRQTNAPEGTKKIEDQTIQITEDFQRLSYLYTNEAIRTRLKLQKTDAESGKAIPLEGVQFKLFRTETGNEPLTFDGVDTFTTDKDGVVIFPKDLPFGTYYLEEVKLPDFSGYYLDPDGKRLKIEINGEFTEVTTHTLIQEVPNIPQKGKILIEKIGERLIGTHVESQEINGSKYDVTIPDFENRPLEGVTFVVRAKEDIVTKDGTTHYKAGDVVCKLVTKADGTAETPELPLGHYEFQEVSTLEGYLISDDIYDIILTEKESNVRVVSTAKTVSNRRESLQFVFTKEFENSKWFEHEKTAPNSTVFGLLNVKDITEDGVTIPAGTLLAVSGLNESLQGTFTAVLAGEYQIKELKTGEAYVLSDQSVPVEFQYGDAVQSGGVTVLEPIPNELKRGSVSVFKYDSESKDLPLEGVGFELYAKTNDGDILVGSYLTDKYGVIRVDNLEYGEYYLVEVSPVKGYVRVEQPSPIAIVDNGSTVDLALSNDRTKVEISKQDATTGVELPGAKLKVIEKETGKTVDEWTSTDQPHIIEKLEVGKTYTLIEDLAPLGYATAQAVDFTISATGEVQKVVMKDEVTTVEISKQDATTGAELPGAKLKVIEKETGKTVEEWISTTTPHTIKGLEVGKTYTLVETIAPDGYEIAESIDFTVGNTGEVQAVVMKDALKPVSNPKTGDAGIISVISAAGLSLGTLLAIRKKKK